MVERPKTLIEKIEKADDKVNVHPLVAAVKLATYPMAALAAFFVGRTEIRKSIYKNFVTSGAFKDMQVDHRKELAEIMKAPETLETAGPAAAELSNKAYRLAVKEKFEKAGFHSIADYWRGLHPNQKTGAVLFAAGAAGAVITTSLAFVNNKTLLEKLTSKEKDEQPVHALIS